MVGLKPVALVELDSDRAAADAGYAIGKVLIAIAAFFFSDIEFLISQEVFGLADGIGQIG